MTEVAHPRRRTLDEMNDRAHHEHWDELALGHVLGGLPQGEASAFRGHLVDCRQCRARVAELRSMASDLVAVEREERSSRRTETQTEARREVEGQTEAALSDRRRWGVLAAIVVGALVLGGLSFWNAHLRAQNEQLVDLAQVQERTMDVLGAGTPVPVQSSDAVTGVVVVDGDRVAYALSGLPVPSSGERLVVWLEVNDELQSRAVHTPAQIEPGRLASWLAAADASRLLITTESIMVPDQPRGQPIVEADLDAV